MSNGGCATHAWGPNWRSDGYLGSLGAVLYCDEPEVWRNDRCITPETIRRAQVPQSVCSGNPILPLSASKREHAVDYASDGVDPLTFERFYGRLGKGLFGFGNWTRFGSGWRSNFDAPMEATGSPASEVRIALPEGRDLTFQRTSTGFVPQALRIVGSFTDTDPRRGATERLVETPTGFELDTADGVTRVYEGVVQGSATIRRLASIRHPGGYTQTLAYAAAGRNTGVTDSRGRSLAFAYDAIGRLTEVTTPGGAVHAYAYRSTFVPPPGLAVPAEGWGNVDAPFSVLERVTRPGAPPLAYHYEDARFPLALTGVTDERGVRTATFAYDAEGRAVSTEGAGGLNRHTVAYDEANGRATVTNPLGKDTIYLFAHDDQNNRLLTGIRGEPSPNCPLSNATLAYDASNFLSAIVDEEGRRTETVRDALGLPTRITRGAGTPEAAVTEVTWNAAWRVPIRVVEPGLTTDLALDAQSRVTAVTQTDTTAHMLPFATAGRTRSWGYTYGDGNLVTSVNGPLPGPADRVRYVYTAAGYLRTVTDENDHVTTVTAWNTRGQPTIVADPNGVETQYGYDDAGRLTSVVVEPGPGALDARLHRRRRRGERV